MRTAHWSSPTKQGQTTTIDFITGLIIIVTSLIIATNLIISLSDNSTFDELSQESQRIAKTLMSTGYPQDWNQSTVVKPGLLTANTLNQTKLELLTNGTYNELKALLGIRTDLYWYYTNASSILNITACGYGDPSIITDNNCTPTINADNNLVRIERLVAYNNSIISMVIMTWD